LILKYDESIEHVLYVYGFAEHIAGRDGEGYAAQQIFVLPTNKNAATF
jgi:hypothetical protein